MGFIYFLQRQNGDIKIGTTTDHKTRFIQLVMEHGSLNLLGTMSGSYELEHQLHERFTAQRRKGSEFFAPANELLEFIRVNSTIPDDIPIKINQKRADTDSYKAKFTGVRLTEDLRQALEEIANALHDEGIPGMVNYDKTPSISNVIRHLIIQEREKVHTKKKKDEDK
jgi:hypothetical protein